MYVLHIHVFHKIIILSWNYIFQHTKQNEKAMTFSLSFYKLFNSYGQQTAWNIVIRSLFLYSDIDRSGAYCFTIVCLSV